jgi:anti-sigma regulatory factor (Ser/Thr protein kinase)
VTVCAEAHDHELTVVVRDTGCGMSPREDSPGAGLGLPLIAQVAGSVSVDAPPGGHGTVVCMTFDLPFAQAG